MDSLDMEYFEKLSPLQKKMMIKVVTSNYETELDMLFDICLLVISMRPPREMAEETYNQLLKHFQVP